MYARAAVSWSLNEYDGVNADSDGQYYWALTGGARLGYGDTFVPYLFGHVGYGEASAEGWDWVYEDSGLAFDFGGALNFESIPLLNAGILVSYHHLEHSEVSNTALPTAHQWVRIGVHAELAF